MLACGELAVPMSIMQHVVNVESSGSPYAIGVVNGHLARQPRNLAEALATAKMLEEKGYNFSLGIAQVNRYNLKAYGLYTYEQAFQVCPNLKAGAKILRECFDRTGHWGKAFSCYYSGNSITGYRHGYVQKIFASMRNNKNLIDNLNIQTNVVVNTKNMAIPNNSIPKSRAISFSSTEHKVIPTTDNVKTLDRNVIISQNVNYPSNHRVVAPNNATQMPPFVVKEYQKVGKAQLTPQVYTDSAFVF